MLLNEFLKEHRKVQEQDRKLQEQETTIAKQRKDFEATIRSLRKVWKLSLPLKSKRQDSESERSDRDEQECAADG